MSSIQTVLNIHDGMSAPLLQINMALNTVISSFETLHRVSSNAINADNIINARDQLTDFEGDLDAIIQRLQQAGNQQEQFNSRVSEGTSIFSRFLQSVGALAMASKAIDLVTGAVDGAISRYDTLHNFPMVMQQMGYSSESASLAIDRLSDGISGLPTALDEMVDKTQRISTLTGDLNYATETTLALNNAFLSSGSSAENVSRGMEQYIQMLSSGKVDMMSWRTLQETMPYALNKVAESFGYTGASAQNNLYKALQKGNVTFDQFNGKLIELSNVTGGFAEVALTATEGVNTAWANLKTGVDRGVADIVASIDNSLENTAFGGIEGMIVNLSDNINSMLLIMANGISSLVEPAVQVLDTMAKAGGFVADNWSNIGPIFYGVAAAIGVYTSATWAHTIAQVALNTALWSSPLTWIAIGIGTIVAAIYLIVNEYNKWTDSTVSATGIIGGIFFTLGAFIMNNFVVPMHNALVAISNFIANVFRDPVGAVEVLFFDMAQNIIGQILNIAQGIESLINKIPGMKVNITSGLDSLYGNIEKASQQAKDESGWVEVVKKMDYIDYEGSFKKGYGYGQVLEEKISSFSLDDIFKNKEAKSNQKELDYSGYSGAGAGISDNIGRIADDTSTIKNSVSVTNEELTYLREIAEKEAVNRFTTAEIKINMNNNNNISSGTDFDGVVDHLESELNRALKTAKEGA